MRTLSSTERLEKRRMFWKVRAMPSRVISKGSSPSMRSPLNSTEPEVSGMMPVMRLKTVVLPAPFGPISP